MIQFEYVIWHFIQKNPYYTPEDILESFAREF